MLLRILALVFAALMVGAAAPAAFAAHEVPSEVDEVPDLHTPVPVMVDAPPTPPGAAAHEAPRPSHGRAYAILVFRPPR